MLLTTKKKQVKTEELVVDEGINLQLAKALRISPKAVEEVIVGHVIPLGGYTKLWKSSDEEFNSDFGLFATNSDWVRGIPYITRLNNINKNNEKLKSFFDKVNQIIKESLGKEWFVAAYASHNELIEEIEKNGTGQLIEIVEKAVKRMHNQEYNRDIMRVIFGASESIATNIIKIVEKDSDSKATPTGVWEETIYEFNYYDEYACKILTGTYTWDIEDYSIQVFKDTTDSHLPVVFKYKLIPIDVEQEDIKGSIDTFGSGYIPEYMVDNGFSFRLLCGINEGLIEIEYVGFPRGYDFSTSLKAKYSK